MGFHGILGFHENLKWNMHVGKTIKHIPQSSPCWWYNLTIPGGKNDMVLPVMAAEDLGT
jgi:hypothetical protein